MEPRLDLLTLGVPDLAAARRFYIDGMGWQVAWEVPGEIVFIQINHGLLMALFGDEALERDVAVDAPAPVTPGSPRISLAQIVATEDEVRDALVRATAAGGTVLKPPQHGEFGGFHGYFADPSGFRWEIATNPGWSVDPDGRAHIGPIGDAS